MNRTRALQIGVLTLWPALCAWSGAAIFGYLIFIADKGPAEVPVLFQTAMVVLFLTNVEAALLLGYLIFHLFKTEGLSRKKKAAWTFALVSLNIAAMPVYWYLNIWKPIQIRGSA